MSKPHKKCRYCSADLDKDSLGLNKKLFEKDVQRGQFMCLSCMASYLDCIEEELRQKIEDFKAEGCKLFS
jgi:hypothetical protein